MLFTIAKRRFLANILTSRFIIAAILIEVLFISSTFVLIREYAQRQRQYHAAVQEHQDELKDVNTYAMLSVRLDRAPAALSVFSTGADRRIARSVAVAHNSAPVMMGGDEEDNPLLAVFSSLDMITIIQVILSLTVLLFSYNLVSEEKERGTLRLILSNSLPRHMFLMGNFLGGLLSFFLPLGVGFLSVYILVYLHPAIQLTGMDVVRFLILIPAAMLFLSAFYSLGALFSILMKKSATSLVFLLFIWVFLVLLLPPGMVYLARQLRPVESRSAVDQRAAAIRGEWLHKMKDYTIIHPKPMHDWTFIRDRWVENGDMPYAFSLGYAPREVAEWLINGSIYGHNLKIENENRIYKLYHEYNVRLSREAVLVDQLSLLSPSQVFNKFTNIVAATDASVQLQFMEQAEQYRQSLIQYIRTKKGLSGYSLISRNPAEVFLTTGALTHLLDTQGPESVKQVISNVYARSRIKPLDLSDLPHFQFSEYNPRDSLFKALPELVILILLNLFFITSCQVMFLRADVR